MFRTKVTKINISLTRILITTLEFMKKEKTSLAFGFASWAALFLGMAGFLVGLWRAEMLLSEKGYYFTILLYGLFSAVAVQKSVRDRIDGIPVSDIFYGISWASIVISIVLLAIGLINAEILPSEKGFYAFGFILALFGAISVQKNNRDNADVENKRETQNSES
ncbi:inner membrane protein YiaA [Dysgonomonas capnocytophagoides]|nr:inner membrane protein YiaA [Dysgonomonas capnocytophagoides]